MQTNAVDLRRNMKDIMRAVERHEPVTIFYHGKEKAVIHAIEQAVLGSVEKHPFFSMYDDESSVENIMNTLRGGRY
ncbi:MAG: type II toxin-antitoxin system prevent-host-death family antitoxin [Mariprofundus sp.]|nr:type II toxin-antitoxin system prevent-host-death family antitoxin [Mariprofundus sp.]